MSNRILDIGNVSRLCLVVISMLVLLFPSGLIYGSAYASILVQPRVLVSSPPVTLLEGPAGTSFIYTNSTSAKVTTAAPAPTPTYNASSYNNVAGTYVSGSVPASIETVDTDYFVARSSGTSTSATAYNPSGYNLIGSTTLVSGGTADLTSNNGVYMTFRSYASASSGQPLYAHNESTSIGGTNYYLLKTSSADSAGKEFSADAGTTTGRKLMAKFVYQLTGVSSIPASTWTIYYRAYKGHTQVVAHGDVDILVRMSNGTIRSAIATEVAESGALATSYSTASGTYSWATYTVVNQADYLEIDYYIHVTQVKSGYSVYLMVDNSNLAIADQTRASNIILPSEFTSEVEFAGSSNTEAWYKLDWAIDSSWTTGSVAVTIQLYNYTAGAYPTSGNGYQSYTSSSTPDADETKTQTMTTNPTHFRNGTGYWRIKVKGVKSTSTQFDLKADWVEFKSSHYSEYTVSTEFLFSSMTKNTPTQLNFTVVSEYSITNVFVTIQVWNYSSLPPAYVTSGEGYDTYTSTGSNQSITLSIAVTPQFYTSGGNAKIKLTGVLTTTTQYQQKANQVKLVYSYSSSPNYNYVLKIVNQVSDPWKIRLNAYSQSNIARLNNCTIYFRNPTDGTSGQIYIISGVYTQQTGPWYDLLSSPAERYIVLSLEAGNSEVSYVYVYLDILVPDKTTYAQYVLTFEIT